MSERTDTAFSFAQDTSKQVLVLATGIITITVALLADIKAKFPSAAFADLHIAWALDAVSVGFGVFTLMALTGRIARGSPLSALAATQPSSDPLYVWSVRILFLCQLLTFLVALFFTVAFGIRAT
jgi:hypothetical protein